MLKGTSPCYEMKSDQLSVLGDVEDLIFMQNGTSLHFTIAVNE